MPFIRLVLSNEILKVDLLFDPTSVIHCSQFSALDYTVLSVYDVNDKNVDEAISKMEVWMLDDPTQMYKNK